jgi:exonuclease SbcD
MDEIHAVFFADTHLGYDHPLRPRSLRKRRGEDFFSNFEFVLNEAKRIKPDFVIHGGDVFDSPYVNESIINLAYEKFFELAECNIPVFIVPGNHERAKLAPSIYMQHPNIKIFSKPETFHIRSKDQDIFISGFPYFYDGIRVNFKHLLKKLSVKINKNALNIMCMHQVLEGAKVGKHNYTFKSNPDVISIKDLSTDYDCYLSGHIHRYQLMKNYENDVPFLYPGSTERTSYQEVQETKGFCKLHFIKNKSRYIMEHEFIPLKTRPLETIEFEDRIYSEDEIKKTISKKIKRISENSVLRYQSEFPENIYKITTKMENELVPFSISIEKGSWSPNKGYINSNKQIGKK